MQQGFACDNVVEFECVLANGTIVTASRESRPHLFFALRGGGNQYAIVTKMTLKTYEIGEHGNIWGGVRTYGADQHAKILSAITRFTANNKDPKAAIIPTFNYFAAAGINLPGTLVFFFYDGTKVPAGVFDDFEGIFSLSDSTKVKKYSTLTDEVLGGDMKGLRFQIRENTFPNMPEKDMTAFLNDHFKQILKKSTEGALKDLLDFRLMSFAVQPMPHGIVQASKDMGGPNALSMEPEQGDRVWVEYDVAWLSPLCDKQCPEYFGEVVNSLHDLHAEKYSGIAPTNYKEGDVSFIR